MCYLTKAYAEQKASLSADQYVSARSAGMAGVGLSHVSNWNAAFLNPALLGDPFGTSAVKSPLRSLSFPSLSAETTPFSVQFVEKLTKTKNTTETGDSSRTLGPVLESLDGSTGVHFRQQLFPNIVMRRFLFGLYQSNLVDAQSYKLSAPARSQFSDGDPSKSFDKAADIFIRSELFGVLGFSVPLGSRASLGIMSRYGARTTASGTAELGLGTEEASSKSILDAPQATQGFSADSGLSILLSRSMGFVLSVVGRNLGEGQFSPIDEKSIAEIDKMDLDAGVSLAPSFRKAAFSPSLSVEVHDILRPDLQVKDKVKIGAEIGFANLFKNSVVSLRGGYDLNAPSVGAMLDLFLFSLEFAAYNHVVIIGESTRRNETRYLLRTSWDLQN